LIECLVKLAGEKAILSAHDMSDGGLAVTLAESCFTSDGLSANVNLDSLGTKEPPEAALFGERGARAVVSLSASSLARMKAITAQYHIKAWQIGAVTRGEFRIQLNGTPVVKGEISLFHQTWAESLERAIESA
jgi:phosphoribosylformylglycinamidine synthase